MRDNDRLEEKAYAEPRRRTAAATTRREAACLLNLIVAVKMDGAVAVAPKYQNTESSDRLSSTSILLIKILLRLTSLRSYVARLHVLARARVGRSTLLHLYPYPC